MKQNLVRTGIFFPCWKSNDSGYQFLLTSLFLKQWNIWSAYTFESCETKTFIAFLKYAFKTCNDVHLVLYFLLLVDHKFRCSIPMTGSEMHCSNWSSLFCFGGRFLMIKWKTVSLKLFRHKAAKATNFKILLISVAFQSLPLKSVRLQSLSMTIWLSFFTLSHSYSLPSQKRFSAWSIAGHARIFFC